MVAALFSTKGIDEVVEANEKNQCDLESYLLLGHGSALVQWVEKHFQMITGEVPPTKSPAHKKSLLIPYPFLPTHWEFFKEFLLIKMNH